MNPTIYLHIGQPKTATSSIQKFMSDNRAVLKKNGILYPATGTQYTAHHPIAGALSKQKFDWIEAINLNQLKDDLLNEIGQSECHSVVISSEVFSEYKYIDFDKVGSLFSGLNIKVVVALRRQDEWLESVVRETMKIGHNRSLSVENIISDARKSVDFAGPIKTWASCFGDENIIVTVFDPRSFKKPVEQSFLETIGGSLNQKLNIGPRANERLSRDCLEFLMNSPHKRRIYPFYWKAFFILAGYSRGNPDPEEYRYILSPEQRNDIIAEVSEGNSEIARKYLANSDGILFDTAPAIDPAWRPYPGLSVENSTKIGIYLSRTLFLEMGKTKGLPVPN